MASSPSSPPPPPPALAIATWTFSAVGISACAARLAAGDAALDAVVAGVAAVEADDTVTSVGYGGLPTACGALELDAAVMDGGRVVGAVGALPGCRGAARVALAVATRCEHAMLVGRGALAFAAAAGLADGGGAGLLTDAARERWRVFREGGEGEGGEGEDAMHTDTVGVICLDGRGGMGACCATSGKEFKLGGRVGDAPLIGAGVYADDEVGAAVASGDGDGMIRFCLSFLVVELMRGGKRAGEACEEAMERVRKKEPGCQAAICAVDARTGEMGYSCTRQGFNVVIWEAGMKVDEFKTVPVPGLPPGQKWKHTCL